MLAAGHRLRDLNWREIAVLVKHSGPQSAIVREIKGDAASWSVTDYLLAVLIDLMNVLVWFKTKDGSKGRNRPKPIARPGVGGPDDLLDVEVEGGAVRVEGEFRTSGPGLTIDEFNALWAAQPTT